MAMIVVMSFGAPLGNDTLRLTPDIFSTKGMKTLVVSLVFDIYNVAYSVMKGVP